MNSSYPLQAGFIGQDRNITANPGLPIFTVNTRTVGQIQQEIEDAEASLVRLKAELKAQT